MGSSAPAPAPMPRIKTAEELEEERRQGALRLSNEYRSRVASGGTSGLLVSGGLRGNVANKEMAKGIPAEVAAAALAKKQKEELERQRKIDSGATNLGPSRNDFGRF